SLGLARAAMRKQKGIAGQGYLDPQPRYLIVPVALETLAEQLIASIVDPSKGNDTPNLQFIRNLTLVADPRLDASSATAWYLAASPNQIDGILRVYLDGQRQPTIIENTEFKRDVYGYKVRIDFGVGVIDHRALHKNPGA
ncbi:MAG: peptidase S14, partial [Polaromonas sp.]|nr:peptidase S14 [Polaromonas sp.]MBA4261715.1 peptidase S14 [Comamonadaceae bacterium]